MILYKTPFKPQTLIAGDVLAYQVKDSAIAHIRACTLHNASGNNVNIEVYILPSNISAPTASAQRLVKKILMPNESYLCPEVVNHVLEGGFKVYFKGEGCNAMLSVSEQAQ